MAGLITTAVGSFPKPGYLSQARSQFAQGKIDRAELDRLERQATEYWIQVQEKLGIDVLVHGEMERGDMVAYFAEQIESMMLGGLVRSYGNRYYHKPIITDKLRWPGPMTVDMWKFAQGLTERPVKGMLTGAYTMVEWSFDEHYPNRREAVLDMASLIREEVQALVAAGAKYIQIDEPAIHTRPDEDFDLAIESMQVTVEGIDAEFHTHICYGDVPVVYREMLKLPVKQIHLAFKNTDWELLQLLEDGSYPKEMDLGVGVTDVHTRRTESVEEIKEGIEKTLALLPPDHIWILPDCGLKTRTVEEAEDKLRVMMDAVRAVKQERGIN